MIAIPWYFADILDMSGTYAKSYAILTFMSLFWGLYSGTLIDKFSRKNLFLISNLCCAIFIGSIASFGIFNGETPWYLVLAVFGITMFHYNIHYPNLYAFGQEITEPKNYGKLNAYIEIQGQSTSILAGGFAAILLTGTTDGFLNILGLNIPLPFVIKAWDIHEIFLMDAITYICAFSIILMIKYTPLVSKNIEHGNMFSRLRNGLLFLKENPLIFIFGVCSYAIFTFLLVEIFVLVPAYVSYYLKEGGDVFASSEVYYSLGALMAGFGIRSLMKKMDIVASIMTLMVLTILACLLLTFTKSVGMLFAMSLLIGLCNAGTRILRITYIFEKVSNTIIGRTGSVFNSISIVFRTFLIMIFSIPFFSSNEKVRFGYLVGALFITLALVPLVKYRKKLMELKDHQN
jgi:DHA3 family macrolide efflux protein-like MFS transporter